jgi:2-oxoglutarate ferredoxin oxidoreductase subunit beta
MSAPNATLTKKDFVSDQQVRWCPGCGDYAILSNLQHVLADLGIPREKIVIVSGIGCAARIPYYVNAYGFHTIHGRAPAIATGIKLANPDLHVWVVGGDGDMLSIGGNHLLHALRRNVDIQILLFNNEVYGLTKGQYSPTSRVGTRTPSTPLGSVEAPVAACSFALGCGARFVARAVDTQQKEMPEILKRAHAHTGCSFVGILQNCIIYNDGVFAAFTDRAVADDAQVHVAHGEPLIFGANRDKGLRLRSDGVLETVTLGNGGADLSDVLVHDETNRRVGGMLAGLEPPMPVAIGVLYCDPAPEYVSAVCAQRSGEGAQARLDLRLQGALLEDE